MLNYSTHRAKNFLKMMKCDVLYYFLQSHVFVNRVAVAVEKDLATLLPLNQSLMKTGMKLIEIAPSTITEEGKTTGGYIYPVNKSEKRYLKAMDYLSKGYRGFALVRNEEIIGDIWCASGSNDQEKPVHPDLKWLRINCKDGEAYAFDMYLHHEQRGKNMAVLLQNGALHEMRKKGFTRVYGYYWAHYIPALWVHRTLQWRELKRIKVSRFLFFHHYAYMLHPRGKKPSLPRTA